VSNFQIRIISGAACAVLVLLLIFTPYYVFHIAVAAAGLVALYELYRTFDQTKKWQLMVLGYVFGVLFLMIPVLPGTISTEMMLFL